MSTSSAILRRPFIDIKFITEENDYEVQYLTPDTKVPSNSFMGESIINLTSKNAMGDDSGAFTFTLTGDTYWDKVLNANDLVILKIYPNGLADAPKRPTVMIGMISEISLQGEYGEDGKMYRITGRSLAKAFMNLQLGLIQSVNVNIADGIGWLPDTKTEDGTSMFTGSNAKNIVQKLYKRFKGYMNYNYTNNGNKTSIRDYLELDVDSWTAYESLVTATPFINFEGSFKQLLDDVAQKPFNELYFESFEDEKAKLVMRPTPFDKDKWNNLPVDYLNSGDVISEDLSRSDNEAYSVFVVNVDDAQALGFDSVAMGVYPQTFIPLVAKYGYKKLEVDNRYLLAVNPKSSDSASSSDSTKEKDEGVSQNVTNEDENTSTSSHHINEKDNPLAVIYNKVIDALEYFSFDKVRQHKSVVKSDIRDVDNRISSDMADKLYDYYSKSQSLPLAIFSNITGLTKTNAESTATKKKSYTEVQKYLQDNFPKGKTDKAEKIKNGLLSEFKDMAVEPANYLAQEWLKNNSLSEKTYKDIIKNYGDITSNANSETLKLFTKKLADWYCECPNFYAGDIRIKGNPDIHIGNRLNVRDQQEKVIWEFYVESVQHDFNWTSGFTTTVGVTRGVRDTNYRFGNLYGKSIDFKGGYLGEHSLEELAEESKKATSKDTSSNSSSSESSTSTGGASGNAVAMNALEYGLKYVKGGNYQTVYSLGGGRQQNNPLEGTQPIAIDCSAFVYWCYRQAGVNLNGGSTGMTTWTILADPQLKKVSEYGSKSADIFNKMKKGDIIMFYDDNGHVGMYAGDKKFVGWNGDGSWDTSGGAKLSSMSSGYWWDSFKGVVLRYGN